MAESRSSWTGSATSGASATTWQLFRTSAVVFAVVAVALVAFDIIAPGGQRVVRAVTDGAFVVFSAAAAVASVRAARLRTPGRRLPWWLLFGAATCYLVGNVVWFYYQVLTPASQTFPGPADVFFVAVVPFALGAMLTLPTGRLTVAARARAIADGLIVGVALLFLSWIIVIGPLAAQLGEASWLYLTVYLYYPLADVLVISVASGLAARASGGERLPMLLVGAGFVAIACADTGIGYLALQGREAAGSGLELGWTLGYMLLALAALSPVSAATAQEDTTQGARVQELLPYLPVLVVLLVAAGDPSQLTDAVLASLFIAMVAVLIVRHSLTLADNYQLRVSLENTVAARTRELDRLSARFQRILESVEEGIYGVDAEGRVSFVNPAAARMLGHSTQALIGKRAHDAFHDEHLDSSGAAVCHLDAAINAGVVVRSSDQSYRRSDGQRFPVEVTAAPKRGGSSVMGAVVVFSDISERKAVEQLKDEFISVVSHELRTPLTAIRGSLGLLAGGASGELPVQAARMVGIALDNCERLTRLINDILDMERIETGALPMDFERCSSGDLVRATVTQLRPAAEAAGVTLRMGPVEGRVHADADRIVQALVNLVGNAVKFSQPGGVVTVSADPEGRHVTFCVADEGRGIPPDMLESIFMPFQQVDSSDTREKGGTGLGLSITRTIVERHGGRIWVESEPGRGSVFRFTIPAAEQPEPTSATDQVTRKPRVLLCDDDPDILELMGTMLQEHGYATTLLARGRDAVDQAVAEHPHVVLMDLRMPGLPGWQAISELKTRPETRDIPVVVMSGLGPAADPQLAEQADGWITKPVDEQRLVDVLADLVHRETSHPSVLVVEDDDDLALVLSAIFERQGLRVVRAASQEEAVARFHETRPDVVVLDIYLSDGDGYGVLDELRRTGRQQIPVIVYTAHQLDATSRERLSLGAVSFLNKGHDSPQELAARVLGVVRQMAGSPVVTKGSERK